MPEYICCRSCDSPSCKGCNIYTLSTMLNNGKFDSLMNDNRSVNPTADVAEVKHGEWISSKEEKLYFNDDMSGFYDCPVLCSNCNFDLTEEGYNETPYCPNCGAKMDGDKSG